MKRNYFPAFLLFLTLAVIFGSHRGISHDGLLRFDALTALLERGQLVGGKYSLIGPLFATPLFYLGKLIHNAAWGCVSYNFLLFMLGLWALDRLLRRHLSIDERFAFALTLSMGSMFPNHLQNFYGEVFTALAVGVGVAWSTRRGWALAALGVANTPATLVGLGLSALGSKRERLWGVAAAFFAVVLILGENYLRRGSAVSSGYEGPQEHGVITLMPFSGRPGFSYPFFLGLVSILFSFGKGLLFYCPGLFAPNLVDAKREPELAAILKTWSLFTLGLILVYAKWWAWYGGWYWGPRFFLFASLPATLKLVLWVRRANHPRQLLLALLLLAWSFWVGVNGIVFGTAGLEKCFADDNALEHLCWYVPEFSPLFRAFYLSGPLHADHYLALGLAFVVYAYVSASGWRRLWKRPTP